MATICHFRSWHLGPSHGSLGWFTHMEFYKLPKLLPLEIQKYPQKAGFICIIHVETKLKMHTSPFLLPEEIKWQHLQRISRTENFCLTLKKLWIQSSLFRIFNEMFWCHLSLLAGRKRNTRFWWCAWTLLNCWFAFKDSSLWILTIKTGSQEYDVYLGSVN